MKEDEQEEANLEDVKLSGVEADMTEEEYRRLFNLARTSTNLVEEIATELEGISKTGKNFSTMTMEEKTDHIEFLNRCMRKVKIFKSSAQLAKQEELMELSESERARVKEYDKKYKPKPRVADSTEKSSSGERKAPQSAQDKFLDMLAKQLGSREAAQAYLDKQKAAKK